MSSYYEKFLASGEVKCIDEEIPFEIPKGWEWSRIGSVLNIWSARRVHERDWRSSGIPFYRAREIGKMADWGHVDNDLFIEQSLYDEFSKSGVPQIGDLMMTAVGTLGKTYVVETNNPFYYKDGSVLCIGNPFRLNPYYLKLFFESFAFANQYLSESDGTTVATLTMVRLNKYLIPVPPLKEQKRIVERLHKISPFIERYSKSQDALNLMNMQIREQLKKSVLQEAIQGKLVPQILEEGTAQELLKRIKAEKEKLVKEGKLKKSVLTDSVIYKGDDNKYYEQVEKDVYDITEEIAFDLPNGWNWCRLKDIGSIFTGATFKKEEAITTRKGVRILRGGNISPFELKFKDDDIFLTEDKVKKDIILKENDILTPAVTSLENIGKMARVDDDMLDTTVGGFVFIIRLHLINRCFSKYILYTLSSPSIIDFMKSITNKSGQAFYNIGKERLSTALLPIPPLKEQQRIVAQIEKLFEQLK